MPAAILDRDGNDVDLARDPVLDELVLPRRIEARRAIPDQVDAQLARRFLGADAAADEVRIALRLRHHRNDRRVSRSAPLRPRSARVAGAARPSDRTSHTLVAGDDQRARDDRAAQDRYLAVLHRNLLLLSSLRTAAGTPRRRSMAIVATSSVPVSTPVSSDGSAARCSPFRSTDNAATARARVPHTVPRPPKTDVPPRTTAVIASSSYPEPASDFA